ncbi:MAG: Lytic transglycosylase catalytic [Thermoleophilia bacterium]|nr:Lytic transglycosylase catalytic [Thermoleophilia bacterium]
MLLACGLAAPLASGADGDTIGFQTALPTETSAADLAAILPIEPLGIEAKVVKFNLTDAESTARDAAQDGEGFRARAAHEVAVSNQAQDRIAAIQTALDEAQGDEEALRAEIQARIVERYEAGEASDLAFLLSGSSLSGLIDRSKVLADQESRDAQLAEDYAYSVARLQQLQQVLDDISDLADERADNFTARADRADTALVAARTAHAEAVADRAPTESEAETDPTTGKPAAPGTWYVMGGAFEAQLFLPSTGSAYDGGETHVPAQKPTPQLIGQVLTDPRVELDASGINDVRSGQIDGRVLQAMLLAANQFGRIKVSALKGDHGVYTTGGNVSEHSYGCAMDIGTIGSTYITPSAQVAGGEVQRAVLFFAGLGKVNPILAPHQVISLFDLGGATLSMSDHGDHIHVGYHC